MEATTMRCIACSHENRETRKFCAACGVALTFACPACGEPNEHGEKFCGGCGVALPAGLPSPAPSAAIPATLTPRTTPPPAHLAGKIHLVRAALEGERKQITILFADVKGSMNLAEQCGPERWFRILEDFFRVAADGVHRFEGTVNQFTGDGVLALFGAPIAHEDHAQRACLAALHIRDAVRAFAAEVGARDGVQFDIRMGLNSGNVVIGRVSDDLSMDYAALGHDVGLAQRMQSLARPGHICLSEHTARLVEGYFELRDLGRAQVKGLADPVGLFDLEGMGKFRTRLDRSRARGLSVFVGRARDMENLEAALERARSGGQVVGIMAEAGTGKSRLCAEFVARCRDRGIPVLAGRGVAHGKSIPLLPMLELWRAYYGIAEGDSPETTRQKISGRLATLEGIYQEELPILFDLFGVPDLANPAPVLDPEQRQKRLHGLVKRVLHDPNHGGPGTTRVILLEDLHWFDGASDAFLETTIASVPATRDLLLLSFRPEYQVRWTQLSYYQHLPLQLLGADAIHDMLRDHLGQDPSVAALAGMIQNRTKGNPFFIEEVLQSLIEKGHLTGERHAYRLASAVAALDVPASVQAVLTSRIDRLAEREKQVLQTAAVIGKRFSEALLRLVLANLSGWAEPASSGAGLDHALAVLQAAEFLLEAAVWPWVEYAFRHPLTQEVAQNSQLRARRRRVHAAVARALEASGGKLDERAAEIAFHWTEADETGHAALWHRRAAQWAGLSDPREALRHWRKVRELAPGVADAAERASLSLQACQQILSIGWRAGFSKGEAASVFDEGRALAERLDDRVLLAGLLGVYGVVRMSVAGSALDYVRYTEEAAQIAARTDNPELRAGIYIWPTFGYVFLGHGPKSVEWSERVLAEVGSDSSMGKAITGYSPRAAALAARTFGLMYLGQLKEAESQAQEAIRVADVPGDFEVLNWSLHVSTWLAYTRGGPGPVLDRSRRCLEVAEQIDNDLCRSLAHFSFGNAYLTEGQPARARESLHTSAAIARDRGTLAALVPQILAMLAEAHLALGERTEALAAAREGIDLGRAGGCYYFEAHAQIALAQILLGVEPQVPRAEIEAALDRAEELVAAIEGRSLSPRILELRGHLAAAANDAPASDRALRQALELYRAIGATGHAERLVGMLAVTDEKARYASPRSDSVPISNAP
jgi:class 3 adenylate cyclase/tetratricopeptide (TPR) repeat protein